MTGVHAVAAIASALLYRERTGKGQLVDVSLLDSYFNCHEVTTADLHRRQMEAEAGRRSRHRDRADGDLQGAAALHLRDGAARPSVAQPVRRDRQARTRRGSALRQPRDARARNEKELMALVQSWFDEQDDDGGAGNPRTASCSRRAGVVVDRGHRQSSSARARHRPQCDGSGAGRNKVARTCRCDSRIFPASCRWTRLSWASTTARSSSECLGLSAS